MAVRRFYTAEELADDDPLGRSAAEFERYMGPALTDEMVVSAEAKSLGVKLPVAFVDLLRESNGGFLRRRVFPRSAPGSQYGELPEWDLVHGLGYIGGLDADIGSMYMSQEWGYPEGLLWIGGDGHTGLFLDYRLCGPQGEPSVVWYDTEENSPEPRTLASTFEEFLGQLG